MKTGIVIFAHGSSVVSANEAVRQVADLVRQAGGFELVETAFLEMAQPDLPSAVSHLAAQGAERILVVPYFLTLGVHIGRDLPRIVEEISRIHQGMEIRVTPPLDGHPALSQIVWARVCHALSDWPEAEAAR